MRILLVEDDRMIGEVVEQSLAEQSYAVDWVRDGSSALTALQVHNYDLVLLDLGLPKKDGLGVVRYARSIGIGTPIIIISARVSLDDRVGGLDSGADDYIVKPFQLAELLARIRVALRRKSGGSSAPILGNGILSLDPILKSVKFNGAEIVVSAKEFALLRALLDRPGAILSRSELEERIYRWGQEVASNAVEVLIHSLRKKLGSGTIKNVRGLGWMVDREK